METIYKNNKYKVVYLGFKSAIGKLYGIFKKEEKRIIKQNLCAGTKSRMLAIEKADDLLATEER